MSSSRSSEAIHIGLVSDEPIRLEGLTSIFEQPSEPGKPRFIPVAGSIEELMARPALEHLVIDLHSSTVGLQILEAIRRARPSVRLIVIGPESNDELVLESIIAGARAYLDLTADAEMVRDAIESVTCGSIWAPRRLLSKLIDRLLRAPDTSLTNGNPHLTDREQQVLELILMARSNREIARQLGIEERTVKAHVGRLMRKTGTENRTELSMRALNRPLGSDSAYAERRSGERGQNHDFKASPSFHDQQEV
jgi:DNA-binding NarL/FixJ family response regulator